MICNIMFAWISFVLTGISFVLTHILLIVPPLTSNQAWLVLNRPGLTWTAFENKINSRYNNRWLAIKRPAWFGSFSKILLNDPHRAGRLIANAPLFMLLLIDMICMVIWYVVICPIWLVICVKCSNWVTLFCLCLGSTCVSDGSVQLGDLHRLQLVICLGKLYRWRKYSRGRMALGLLDRCHSRIRCRTSYTFYCQGSGKERR